MNGIIINQHTNKYSENLFNIKSVFDGSVTLNKTGGTSLATITYDNELIYKSGKSIKSYIYESDEVSPVFNQFNLGNCLSFTAPKDGTYVFSFNALQDYSDVLDGVDKIVVTKFVNSIPQDITFPFQLEDGTNLNRKKWYNFSQSFLLEMGDVVDFSFKHYKEFNSAVTSSTLYLDGFKIELSDRFNGIPTPYSLPIDYFLSNKGTNIQKVTNNIEMASGVAPTLAQHLTTKAYTDAPENQTQSQISTLTVGTENVTNNGRNTVLIHDAAVTPTLTINLPSTPVNNQIVTLVSVLGITTLTLNTLVGTIISGATSLAAGVSVRYMWIASQNKWFRI